MANQTITYEGYYRGSQTFLVFIRLEWHAVCMFETAVQTWMEREMAEKLGSEYMNVIYHHI